MKSNLFRYRYLSFIIILMISKVAQCQAILTENFDYPIGNQLINNNWVMQGTDATNPILIEYGNLNYPSYLASGKGNSIILNDNGQDAFRVFNSGGISNGILYVASLVQITSGVQGQFGDLFLSFKEQTSGFNTNYRGRVYAKLCMNGKLAFGITKGAVNSSIKPNFSDSVYNLNSTYLIVLKYAFIVNGDDPVVLYINPTNFIQEPSTGIAATDPASSDALKQTALLIRQGIMGISPKMIIDGIRIAESWRDLFASSSVATLKDIKVDGNSVKDFSSSVLEYNVQLPSSTTQVPNVTSTSTDASATVLITKAAAIPGNTVINVTAEDGSTKLTYYIKFSISNSTTLEVSTNSITFDADNNKTSFYIYSNIDWSVSSQASWLVVSKSSGSGNATITLTAEPNSTMSLKTATITVAGNGISNQIITVSVLPQTVGGSVSGSSTICFGSSSGTLTLSGFTGTITKWQKRVDNGSWQDVSNTNTTYSETPSNIGSWEYRAVLQSGTSTAYSTSASVTVSPVSVGGSVSGSTSIIGENTGTLTLSGHTGTVQKWQKQSNNGTWTDISNTNTTYSETPTTEGTWNYRAVVKSGVCSEVFSNPATITVMQKAAAGSVSGSTSICSGNSSGTLTLSGHTGTLTKWQKRINNGAWQDISNTSATYSETPARAGSWEYRAETSYFSQTYYSNSATIVVKSAIAPRIKPKYQNEVIICPNTGDSLKSYKWFKNGNQISSETKQFLPMSKQAGQYYVMATDLNGCEVKSNTLIISAVAVSLYPNPANQTVNLIINDENTGKLMVKVYNSLGFMVKQTEYTKADEYFNTDMNLQTLTEGIYTVEIRIGDTGKYNQRMVITR